jgi:hypothetical protein
MLTVGGEKSKPHPSHVFTELIQHSRGKIGRLSPKETSYSGQFTGVSESAEGSGFLCGSLMRILGYVLDLLKS